MAPAVPFALLGVVQLAAVAAWLAFAAASCFPGMIRRSTPIVVIGALAMATADALTALHLAVSTSDGIGIVRLGGLALLAVGLFGGAMRSPAGMLPAITAPLGARPSVALAGGIAGVVAGFAAAIRGRTAADRRVAVWIGGALVMTGVAAALADPSRDHARAALAQLSARALATLLLLVAIGILARGSLLGKVVGAIVAGVVAMSLLAVAVVGIGVASKVQSDQSKRLLSVATAQEKSLDALGSRAGIFARVVATYCPNNQASCVVSLQAFADNPGYFAAVVQPKHGARVLAPTPDALDNTALIEIAGSSVVRAALKRSATVQTAPSGPILLHGNPPQLAVIAAAPGRPNSAVGNSQVRPTFAAVYGITLVDRYLQTVAESVGYGVSVIADGQVLASSLPQSSRLQLLQAALKEKVGNASPSTTSVVPADGGAPSVAFVPITAAGNDNVRVGTFAISQRASVALAAQRSVLRRLVLTALAVLIVVAILAFAMAQRIADPVRRLTIAAGRVQRGDLDARVEVDSRDEVGALARAFEAMTASLRRLTSDLRDTAAEESRLRARLETVVGSMTDGLVTTDGDGVIVAANPMALELLGCNEADVVGRQLVDAIDVRGADGEPLMTRRRTGDVEGSLRRTNGDEVPVRYARAPLQGQPGEVVVLSDRTRERELERLKTEFLANVSHELRTPLTPIRGYAEMLVRRPDLDGEKSKGFLTEILNGTQRMSRAVELLVDVSALDAGQVVPERREVKIATIADERVEAWRARFPARASDFRRRVAAKLPAVDVDPVWLAKALDELADNAVKFTSAGTPITLTAALTADRDVSIGVRDAGPGIDTDRLHELLGDFSQADASETRPVGGFGLGLGFVRRVAAALGARLDVTSSPGKGAEFALIVPAVNLAGRADSTRSSRRKTAGSTRRR